MKDAVDDHLFLVRLEIEAPVVRAKAVEDLPVAFDFSKAFVIEVLKIFLGYFEFIEELELFECAELGDFGSGDFIKNDLKHGLRLPQGVERGKGDFGE